MIVEINDERSYRKQKKRMEEEESHNRKELNEEKWLSFVEHYLLFILSYMKRYQLDAVCEEENDVFQQNISSSITLLKDIHVLRYTNEHQPDPDCLIVCSDSHQLIYKYLRELSRSIKTFTQDTKVMDKYLSSLDYLKQCYPLVYKANYCHSPWVISSKGVASLYKRKV